MRVLITDLNCNFNPEKRRKIYWISKKEREERNDQINIFDRKTIIIISFKICFEFSGEPSHRDSYFEYPQHVMFWLRTMIIFKKRTEKIIKR